MLACGHDPNGLKPGCRDCAALASRRGWFFHPPKAEAAAATPAPPPPPEPAPEPPPEEKPARVVPQP